MTLQEIKEIELTELEKKVVDYFNFNYKDLESNLQDNANFVDFSDVEGIEAKVLRGVFSSLIKKGIIFYAEDCDVFYISNTGVILFFLINYPEEVEKADLSNWVEK